jgi:hypothetical protein
MVAAPITAIAAAALAGEIAAPLDALPVTAFATGFSLTCRANLGDGTGADNRALGPEVKLA